MYALHVPVGHYSLILLSWGSIIVWRLGGFGLILDAEFGFRKIISAVYGFVLSCGCGKLEFKRTVYGFCLQKKRNRFLKF